MVKIEAYLRPAALEQVQEALAGIGIAGLSVLEVRGYGRQRGHREVYRGAEYAVDFVPKSRSRSPSAMTRNSRPSMSL